MANQSIIIRITLIQQFFLQNALTKLQIAAAGYIRILVTKFRRFASGYNEVKNNGGPGETRTPNQAVMSRRL